jgi:hypothetical protein
VLPLPIHPGDAAGPRGRATPAGPMEGGAAGWLDDRGALEYMRAVLSRSPGRA